MFRKKAIAIVLILVIGLSFTGCKAVDVMKGIISSEDEQDVEIVRSGEEDTQVTAEADMRETVLYYRNEAGYLVPVRKQIPWETGIAKAALRNIIDTPALREDLSLIGLEPIIPVGTEIVGMSIGEDGLCKINFNNQVLNYESKKQEENLITGVVYTLTEFSSIKEVQFMVDGKVLSNLEFGTPVSTPIKREDINLVDSSNEEGSDVLVYYKGTTNGEYEYYVPVTVHSSAPNEFTALEKLFEGAPEASGLYTDIPEGVYLQDVVVSEGIAFVDLIAENKDILSQQITFDRMSKNIGLTLNQFKNIEIVEILIGGKTLEEAGLDVIKSDALPVFANEY